MYQKKCSRKIPEGTCTCAYTGTCAYQGVRNVSFSENLANVPNEWSLDKYFSGNFDYWNDFGPQKIQEEVMEVIFVTDQSPEQACMTYYNISNGVILKNFKNSSCARHGFGFIGNDLLLATQHNKQLINVYETSKVRTGYFIRINYQHINLLPRGRFLFCKDFSVQSEQYGH